MKQIINISVTIALAIGLIFLFVFANIRQKSVKCTEFVINIDYDGSQELITKSSIRREITKAGIRVKDQNIQSIPVQKLQTLLTKNPYVKKVSIVTDINGTVKANILQRNPLLRVIDKEYHQLLIDCEGKLMPINNEFPVRLLIANGNITSLKTSDGNYTKGQLKEISRLRLIAQKLTNDSLTNALIEQVYINESDEIELIPKLGNETIILGDTTYLDQKIRNLKAFCNEGLSDLCSNKYKTINLKYKNQVVCTK